MLIKTKSSPVLITWKSSRKCAGTTPICGFPCRSSAQVTKSKRELFLYLNQKTQTGLSETNNPIFAS
jgi:hypothetical protein